jgi:hypothetical protein
MQPGKGSVRRDSHELSLNTVTENRALCAGRNRVTRKKLVLWLRRTARAPRRRVPCLRVGRGKGQPLAWQHLVHAIPVPSSCGPLFTDEFVSTYDMPVFELVSLKYLEPKNNES